MLVICFLQGILAGGFGDRIVGLISIRLFSKLLNQPFYICWNKENVREYINYSPYDFETLGVAEENIILNHCMNRQSTLKDYLKTTPVPEMFDPTKANCFLLNQEDAQFLYQNPAFEKNAANYYADILGEYKKLYTDILKPTPALIEKINRLVWGKTNIVGIQLRCGDKFISNCGESYTTGIVTRIDKILADIKNRCDFVYGKGAYNIFLTSDYDGAYSIAVDVWRESAANIIYNADLIQHLDREAMAEDFSKVFVDNFILSQCTSVLFITEESNYGRVAALSSVHDNIYGLTCKKLDAKKLFSKAENMVDK